MAWIISLNSLKFCGIQHFVNYTKYFKLACFMCIFLLLTPLLEMSISSEFSFFCYVRFFFIFRGKCFWIPLLFSKSKQVFTGYKNLYLRKSSKHKGVITWHQSQSLLFLFFMAICCVKHLKRDCTNLINVYSKTFRSHATFIKKASLL